MYPAFVIILVNTQRTSNALTSLSESSEPEVLPGHHETSDLESMRFNENPIDQGSTVGLVSRQTQSAMFNVTIDARGRNASFNAAAEEGPRKGSNRT